MIAAGIERVVVGAIDPNPRVSGSGLERLRESGLEVELADGEIAFRARRQNEAWRTWIAHGRPFVTYKVAVTLDGRVTLPGSRWLSGERSRRCVHELRVASDAVAVGMGTVLVDSPRLDAREVGARHQPRRLAFGKRAASGGLGARAPLRSARRGVGRTRRRRRPVTAARRRADACHRLRRGRAGRQAARVRDVRI